jgi:enamine deaminase RidA (YjgF/YER057c/UK114 family)
MSDAFIQGLAAMMHSRLPLVAAAACALAVSQAPPPLPPPFLPVVARGGFVFVSGILPAAPPAGSVTEQARQVLDELKAQLASAGTSMDQVVSTTVFLAGAEDFAALNAVWEKYWPSSPPARTTVVAKLRVPGARIQVSAIAAASGSGRAVVLPTGWASPPGPLSYAVRAGDTLFLSGLVPRRGTDHTIVEGGIEAQTKAVFDNAEAILAAAGMSLADVVSARVFLTDGAAFDRMNAAYRTRFPADPPARATVITPLVSPGFLIEITMVAVKGSGRTAVLTPNADGSPGRPNPNLSSAIHVGPRLFLSGMLGVIPGTASDAAAQTEETLNRLERTMTTAGFGWPDVTEAVIYVTDASAAPDVLRVFAARHGGRGPAGTIIGTGLVSPEGRVEIMLNASK